jgi:hypothetical protein
MAQNGMFVNGKRGAKMNRVILTPLDTNFLLLLSLDLHQLLEHLVRRGNDLRT